MNYLVADLKRELMHAAIRRHRARGLSFPTSMWLAFHEIDGDYTGACWPMTANDLRILGEAK